MKTLLSLLAVSLLATVAVQAQNIPGTPSAVNFQLVSADPTAGGACTNSSIVEVNWISQTIWGCFTAPNTVLTQPFSQTWVKLAGGSGLAGGFGPAVASATTIAPKFQFQHVTGTTPIVNITPPAGLVSGSRVTLIADAVWSVTNAGNITGVPGTIVVGNAYPFIWDATAAKFIYEQ